MFEPDGPMWVKMVDPEADVREEDENEDDIDDDIGGGEDDLEGSSSRSCEVVLQDGQEMVVSHPRRKNHRINMKRSPPMTPSKSSTENSACLVERRH